MTFSSLTHEGRPSITGAGTPTFFATCAQFSRTQSHSNGILAFWCKSLQFLIDVEFTCKTIGPNWNVNLRLNGEDV